MKRKLSIVLITAGFLSGIAVFYIFIYLNWPFAYYPSWKRERYEEFFKDVKHMTEFFQRNRVEFKSLELYMEEDREWTFGFYQYYSSIFDESRNSYYYRTTEKLGIYWLYDLIESPNIAMIPSELRDFLNFSAGKREVMNVILHGDHDIFDSHRKMKRYLEVRCYEGEEVVSYIYAPNEIEKDEWDMLIDLEDGWYFGIDEYVPAHLRDSE